jgi:hypothetical protein
MDVDVLALQEVEDVGTLRNFVRDYLDNAYRHIVLIEGNDPRLIDVALVSKLPLGQATSWQHARHKSEPTSLPIFSRDLLEVDVLAPGRATRLSVHHMQRGGPGTMENLVTLCSVCHPRAERIARQAEREARAHSRPAGRAPYRGPEGQPWSRQWFDY